MRSVRALLPICLAAIVHYRVVLDFFKHDDFIHLYQIANHGFWEFLLTPHGGHLLVASNLVFYLCFHVFGMASECYHGLALVTHLVNVGLLFLVVERTTGRRVLAIFGAAMWGMSPLARGSVGWFSVYGHVLAATAIRWVLVDVAKIRQVGVAVPRGMMLRWLALLLAAAMSFGVGLGVAMVFGGVVYALLPATPNRTRTSMLLGGLVLLLPAIYFLQHAVFEALWGPPLADGRAALARLGENFTDCAVMFVELLAYAISSLLGLAVREAHGRVLLPLFEHRETDVMLVTALIAAVYAAGLAWALARSPRERRWEIGGFLLLALAAYAVIAVGRGGVMAARAPSALWAVSSPRYHYVGTIGLVVALCLALARIPRRRRSQGPWLLVAWLALAFPLDVVAARSIESEAGRVSRAQYGRVISRFRRAIEKRPEGSDVFIENRVFAPVRLVPLSRFPGEAAAFVFTFPENEVDGRRVYFVERHRDVLAAAAKRRGSRIDDLLISRVEKQRLKGAGSGAGRR